MNPSAVRILGKTPEEVAGRDLMDDEHVILGENGSPIRREDHPCLVAMTTGREAWGILGVYNPREHNYRWIELWAVPLLRDGAKGVHQVHAIFEDITERHLDERHIRRQTNLVAGIKRIFSEVLPSIADDAVVAIFIDVIRKMTASPIGFSEMRDPGSKWFCVTLERSLQVAEDMAWVDVFTVLQTPEAATLRQLSATGRSQRINRPSAQGGIRRFLSVPFLEHGRVTGCIGLVNKASDYTESDRQAVEMIAQAFAEVLGCSRCVRQDEEIHAQTIGSVRLDAGEGFSRFLVERHADWLDEVAGEYLRHIRKAAEHMAGIITGMLQLAQISRSDLKLTPVNLSLMASAVSERLLIADSQRKIQFLIEPNLIVRGDARLLKIVVENLLGNAWKFSGSRAISKIEFGRTMRRGELTYFVRDNGVGFDMRSAHKLFNAFQRLHVATEFPGDGIGLAVVQRIIHRHGGSVTASSEPDNGATFYFTLSD